MMCLKSPSVRRLHNLYIRINNQSPELFKPSVKNSRPLRLGAKKKLGPGRIRVHTP